MNTLLHRAVRRVASIFCRCEHCGRLGASKRKQATVHRNETDNWATLCPSCQHYRDEFFGEFSGEYTGGSQ